MKPMPPDEDQCHICHRKDCKLYRRSASFQLALMCIPCLCERFGFDTSDINLDGSNSLTNGWEIGNYLPAVPDGEGHYWGWSSMPQEEFLAWKELPNA
jgi:hypothetical protein